MVSKISKILESIIAQTAFDAARAGVDGSFKDYLALALLRNEGSLAHRILARRMAEWQIYQLVLRIENQLRTAPAERDTAEEFFRNYRQGLVAKFGDSRRVSTLHALIDILSDFRTISSALFARYGVTAQVVESEVEQSVGGYADSGANGDSIEEQNLPDVEANAEHKSAGIEQFGVDVTRQARQGKIDPVIGREQEIERVVRVLSRRKKNNPVLVGQAGVGKSAIVEGLAQRIVDGQVPYMLLHKRIISLDVSSLIAGTKYRGEFEERMQQLLSALEGAKDTILFIDEIHTIVGAGATQGALDVANILKPALSRGQIQTIGATTLVEYRQSIERDAALERRFQRVMVEPTTAEQTLTILRKAAPIYEEHHRVKYTERALVACVELADRYISERYFPDKAIDLMDEAGAQAHLESKGGVLQQRELRQAIATATVERERAVREYRYNVAVEARLKEIALKHRAREIANSQSEDILIVDSEHIARTLTAITGVPTSRISADERTSLQQLEGYLKSRVVGQDAAIETLAKAIRRSRAGLKEESRPCGVFMFVGTTGVGKTLLAKELAVWLAGSADALIRLDMSEYSQQHNVARLFGAPPGYVGYGEGGQLTEAVRRRPYSVVLFDEIEKAHPQVFNAMLQIFDEGQLTDGEGRKVDFKNTIIIMTSNIAGGNRNRVGYATDGRGVVVQGDHRKALERTFSPEFINRIDEVVYFNNLSLDDARQIVAIELQQIAKRLGGLGYALHITDKAIAQIVKQGFEARYGARSIKRMLRSVVEQPLAELLVNKDVIDNQTITLDWSENELVLM